jgi:hypothetical protein
MAGLSSEESNRAVRWQDFARCCACITIEPGRNIDSKHFQLSRLDRTEKYPSFGLRINTAAQAGPENRIDNQVDVIQINGFGRLDHAIIPRRHRGCITSNPSPVAKQYDFHTTSTLRQITACNEPIPAIIPRPTDHQDI